MIGFYGGTFSPPHMGHVHAAEMFSKALNLSTLYIIPTAIPPHKSVINGADGEQRLEMCRLAFGHIQNAVISDLELSRGGKSYTADTIAELCRFGKRVAMLIGTDMFLSLDTWYRPDYIFEHADIYCIRRESDSQTDIAIIEKNDAFFKKFGKRVIFITCDAVQISSTEVRASIQNNENCEMLSPAVAAYIREKGLYL